MQSPGQMSESLISVFSRGYLSNEGLQIRLMHQAQEPEYYLLCTPRSWPDDASQMDSEHIELVLQSDKERSWECSITTREAEQWIKALSCQSIKILPQPPRQFVRDGNHYEVSCGSYGNISLSWDNHTPIGWEVAGLVKDRFLEIAKPQPNAPQSRWQPTTINIALHIFRVRVARRYWLLRDGMYHMLYGSRGKK